MSQGDNEPSVVRPTGRRLVLWRHGRTEWNVARRFQGSTDVPLDDVGEAQARNAAAQLSLMQPGVIVSSDLIRARVTAEALSEATDVPVAIDPRLRETHAGVWEGLDRTQLMAHHADDVRAWAAGSDLRPGGGERRSEVATRMLAAIGDALDASPEAKVVVVVTHGGAARAAVGALLGLPVAHWSILGVLTNCAWSVLSEWIHGDGEVGGRVRSWRLEEYNARSLPESALGDDR